MYILLLQQLHLHASCYNIHSAEQSVAIGRCVGIGHMAELHDIRHRHCPLVALWPRTGLQHVDSFGSGDGEEGTGVRQG